MSKIEEFVINDIKDRAAFGLQKYGVTMERNDLYLENWLQHAYEESLDLAVYLKRSILDLQKEKREILELKAELQRREEIAKEALENAERYIERLST